MTARAAIYNLLSSDSQLLALGVEEVYASNSIDTPEENIFLVLRGETGESRAYGSRAVEHLTVWVHSKDRDYSTLDLILKRVKTLLGSAVHLAGSDGWTLTQADWRSDSADLVDGGFHTITRYSDFAIVSRYTMS